MTKPTIDCYKSEVDGVWVVHVDTEGCPEDSNGPIMRVYINDDDDPVYVNPPVTEAEAEADEVRVRAERMEMGQPDGLGYMRGDY